MPGQLKKTESDDELMEEDLLGLPELADEDDASMEDDPYSPAVVQKKKRAAASTDFDAGLILSTPRVVMQSVRQLFDDIESGDIDLEPDYQRSVVWPRRKQSAVIQSLLSHYYVPPVLMCVKQQPDGSSTYTCIDGKQRLSSIKLFMKNEIPVYDQNNSAFYYKHKKLRSLPDGTARRFTKEMVPMVLYENLTDDQEREMFQRVQMGVSLSPAEKLSALKNKWTMFFDQLTKRYMDPDLEGGNLCHIVKTERSKDWLMLAMIALMIYNAAVPNWIPVGGNVEKFIHNNTKGPSKEDSQEICDALTRYLKLANEEEWNTPLLPRQVRAGLSKRQLSPVEFCYIGFMIWRHPKANFYELAAWTGILREEVHEKAPGQVRFNNTCAAILRDRIETFVPAAGATPSIRKRKRRGGDDDEDDEADDEGRPSSASSSSTTAAAAAAAAARRIPRPRTTANSSHGGQVTSGQINNESGPSSLFLGQSPEPSSVAGGATRHGNAGTAATPTNELFPHIRRSAPQNPYK